MLDLDDIIVPRNHINWKNMMKEILAKSGRKSSYHFKNYYYMSEMLGEFDPNIPQNMLMMQNIYRSKRSTNQFKSIHRVEDLSGNIHIS